MDKKQFLNYLKKGGKPYLKLPYNKELGPMINIMSEFFDLNIDGENIGSYCIEIPSQLDIIRTYPFPIYIDSLAQL